MNKQQDMTAGAPMVRGRRGVAMLMVVIALVVTTVLTTAILTAPDRLGPIAENKNKSAAARWSAMSASNFTVAAIEEDLEASAAGGMFKDEWAFAGANVSSVVTDVDGNAPDADDRTVVVTITSDADGMQRTVQRRVRLIEAYDPWKATDPRMSEFAVYATGGFHADGVKIAPWYASPEARTGVARLGLAGLRPGEVSSTSFGVSKIVIDEDTDDSVAAWAKGAAGSCEQLPVSLPASWERQPVLLGMVDQVVTLGADLLGGVLSGGIGQRMNINANVGDDLTLDPGRYDKLRVMNGANVVLDSGAFAFEEIDVKNSGTLTVRGDVHLVVYGLMCIVNASQVVLEEGATLKVWIQDDLYVSDSVIGPWRDLASDPDRDLSSLSTYTPASDVVIELGEGGDVDFVDNAIVFGNIHAVGSYVDTENAIIVGRISGKEVSFTDTYVLYDPALDSGYGYTNPKGPLYYDNGTPIAGLDPVSESGAFQDPDDLHFALKSILEGHWTANGIPNVSTSGYAELVDTFVPVDMFESEKKYAELYELEKVRENYLADLKAAAVKGNLEAMGLQRTAEVNK